MKTIFFCLLVILSTQTACNEKDLNASASDQDLRLLAWKYLNEDEQASVNNQWEEAAVRPFDCCPYAVDRLYNVYEVKEKVVGVIFNTDDDALLGPIVVFINPESLKIWGIGPRL